MTQRSGAERVAAQFAQSGGAPAAADAVEGLLDLPVSPLSASIGPTSTRFRR